MTTSHRVAGVIAAITAVLGVAATIAARMPSEAPPTPEEKAEADRLESEQRARAAEQAAKQELARAVASIERRLALVNTRARRFSIAGWVSIALPFLGWGIAALIWATTLAPLIVITAAPIAVGVGLHITAAVISRKGRKRLNEELAQLQR